ncbi:EGF-like repeat and discoidin I-like domain-containing protein 3 [Actinia tenebrosa]|uniref:EGF-like repeat and discoidin I-like domain-containing protein 3 n=1 Tax=Actinia tenebrosa TaxID=6105 RepID=A0A6P8HXV1_ACTTE|nr:EGF-like repeat and discoidin I-like domain-containing protein 3 [Actinia tenebrosa]
MRRQRWSVRAYKGRVGFIRLVDYYTGGWGHINFDDLRGGIRCERSCISELGMRVGKIPNSAITASSQYNAQYGPQKARLNGRLSWIARLNRRDQFLQVDFGRATKVTGIATQGRPNAHQWITRYTLSFSQDGTVWTQYKEQSSVKYFQGNKDRNTIKVNHPVFPIRCRFIRIHPYYWRSYMAMRAEFYGCNIDKCKLPIGLEDQRIDGGQLSASTSLGGSYEPWRGALNHVYSWCSRHANRNQWLQTYEQKLMVPSKWNE